ncbi:uncharacterized protein LOC143228398 [Tachypleus tridentatus]|uniref:uncharacterized protein LOC143228398 n=1 Tax=Tachypleus tridentatus TaxID=6853 RepID=UPI003FD4B414
MYVKTVRHRAKASFVSVQGEGTARWRQWVGMVNRKNWTPSHHAKLCQDHFERLCFVSDPTVLDSVYFKPGRLRLKKPSVVDRIVPTTFPRVELRADLSLQCSGSTPLKPSLAITKRINLKTFVIYFATFFFVRRLWIVFSGFV